MYNTEKNSINYSMENKTHKLVLFNDDVHDFLYVIACLMKYCNHDRHQAEQCALIAHSNGSIDVASGDFMKILEIHENLSKMEMKTEISEYA